MAAVTAATALALFVLQATFGYTCLAHSDEVRFHDPSEFSGEAKPAHNHDHSIESQFAHPDRSHLESHTNEHYVKVDQLKENEILMEMFRQMDLDGNGHLDGLEMLTSRVKMMEEDQTQVGSEVIETIVKDIDTNLDKLDSNKDGLVSFAEMKGIRVAA